MKNNKQKADFLHIGTQLINWYKENARDLPFRKTKNPYEIWICEIVFQQTRIQQGLAHYIRFIKRFPNVEVLANSNVDEVLLHWKGLGYYSRAINIHKAANQIMNDFNGVFPNEYDDILNLRGIGKYTASAISSICFGAHRPAVDGNFYRVLSRFFSDDFDISNSKAFTYFSNLALRMMPKNSSGLFNQAMMDLGSEVCKPKLPLCNECPINSSCMSYGTGKVQVLPFKKKKIKVSEQKLVYYFVYFEDQFLVQQRGDDSIWKRLFEFPTNVSGLKLSNVFDEVEIKHRLSHIKMEISIIGISFTSFTSFSEYAKDKGLEVVLFSDFENKSFPKPLENYIYSKING